MPTASTAISKRREWYRRRWAKVVWGGVGLLLLAFIVITFVPLGGPLKFQLQAAKINAQNSFTTATSTSSSPQAGFWLNRVAVVDLSPKPIMARVTDRVAKRLQALPMVGRVDEIKGLKSVGPPNGRQRAYDLYITLDMSKFKTSEFVLFGRTVDATVHVAAGDSLWGWNMGRSDSLSPPTLGVGLGMMLDHHSVTTGYQSANARYELVIKNIAQQIDETLTKNLEKWCRKSALHPRMPSALYAAARSIQSGLPLPASSNLIVARTSHGLMMHNHTIWTMQTNQPRRILLKLRHRLKTAGWRITFDDLTSNAWTYQLDASCGTEVYKAFDVSKKHPPGQFDRLVIDYRDRMSKVEIQPLVEPLLKNPKTSVDMLMMVGRYLSPSQHDELIRRLTSKRALPAAAQLMLARDLHRRHRDSEAMQRLHAAYVADLARDNGSEAAIKKLGRKITGDKQWKPKPPDAADFNRLGISRLAPGKNATTGVSLGQPAVWYQMEHKQGHAPKAYVVSVTVEHAVDLPDTYSVRLEGRSSGGSAISTTETPQDSKSPFHDTIYSGLPNLPLRVEVTQIAPKRFRVHLSGQSRVISPVSHSTRK